MKNDLSISSVGDVSFSTGMENHKYDFKDWISNDVRAFLKADIQIGNLECVFYPHGKKRPTGFNLSEEDTSIKVLLNSGFDVFNLANNHICDYYGKSGIEHTIGLLDKNGVHYCGAGVNIQQAQRPCLIERKGYKVGVFGRIHEASFTNIANDIATIKSAGSAPLVVDELKQACEKAKQDYKLDLAILAVHWGIQDVHNHTSEIHRLANEIIMNSKIDIILGSHSHCIQGITETRNKAICYGQGNFYFYPQLLDEGVLYNDKQDLNRTSLVTKINLSKKDACLSLQAKVVKQNEQNTIIFLDKTKADKILNKVFGKWQNDRKLAFYCEYRLRALYLDFNKFKSVFNNSTVRKRFFQLILSPKKLIKKIWMTCISSQYK